MTRDPDGADGGASDNIRWVQDPSPSEAPRSGDDRVSPGGPEPGRDRRCRIIAFGSGAGGAGKSLLAANVAIYLAQLGKQVIAVDADPAGGTLHRRLGTPRPTRGYGDFLRGVASLGGLVVETPVAGLGLVASEARGFPTWQLPDRGADIADAIRGLEADYVVLDVGHPAWPLCLDLWLLADTPVLIALPEPASIDATYRVVKSGFVRRLEGIEGLAPLMGPQLEAAPAALDLYRAAAAAGGPTAALAQEMTRYRPRLVVNQIRSLADLKLGVWMAAAAQRRLGHGLEYLGHMESDEAVWVAARRHRPLVVEYPESKVAKNIEKVVRRLLATEGERAGATPLPRADGERTHYEVLETEPGVSDEEIRRAYRRLKEIYADGSLATAGLFSDEELVQLHARAAAAHDVLFTPDRRRQYDLSLPESDRARATRAAPKAAARPPEQSDLSEPVVAPDAEITGALLRRIREARGLDLSDVAQRTKISERHLRSIEEERFADMPAAVYVRGFVTQYARILRVDPARAVMHYLKRYQVARAAG